VPSSFDTVTPSARLLTAGLRDASCGGEPGSINTAFSSTTNAFPDDSPYLASCLSTTLLRVALSAKPRSRDRRVFDTLTRGVHEEVSKIRVSRKRYTARRGASKCRRLRWSGMPYCLLFARNLGRQRVLCSEDHDKGRRHVLACRSFNSPLSVKPNVPLPIRPPSPSDPCCNATVAAVEREPPAVLVPFLLL